MHDFTVAILAGGKSERMGRDKAEIVVAGETMLGRTVRVARESGATSVIVIGREKPDGWEGETASFIADAAERRGQGPLAGLATTLENSPTHTVILLACDMPALSAEALRWLALQTREDSIRVGVVAVGADGEIEPLFSLYTKAALPALYEILRTNRRSLKALIETGQFDRTSVPAELHDALVNVNTPEEWENYLLRIAPANP